MALRGTLVNTYRRFASSVYLINFTDKLNEIHDLCSLTGIKAALQAERIALRCGFERELNGTRERLHCLEAMRIQTELPIEETDGEHLPQEYPLGPPEDYDFMEVLRE